MRSYNGVPTYSCNVRRVSSFLLVTPYHIITRVDAHQNKHQNRHQCPPFAHYSTPALGRDNILVSLNLQSHDYYELLLQSVNVKCETMKTDPSPNVTPLEVQHVFKLNATALPNKNRIV